MSSNGKARERDASVGDHQPSNAMTFGDGTVGGQAGLVAESSTASTAGNNVYGGSEDGTEAELGEYFYQRGFLGGEYGDVQLHYRPDRQPLKLHSLVLSLSPVLSTLLSHPLAPQQPQDIFLPLNGHEEITDEGLWIAIGFLYSNRSLAHVAASNAPAVLSASVLLQIPKLAKSALRMCKDSIESTVRPQEVNHWIAYLASVEQSSPSGAAYWNELRSALMTRLVSSLPHSLHAFSTSTPPPQQTEALSILQHIYAVLPFELFKAVLESPRLGVGAGDALSDQTRFGLAKKCVAERKKSLAAQNRQVAGAATANGVGSATAPAAAPGSQDYEETVVLAFGANTSGGSNVNIVRKPKQNRKLWKVNS